MPSSPDEPDLKSIEFVFEEDQNYRIVGANAVYGGLTVRGDMLLDFCVDYSAVPERISNAITDKKLGPEINRFPPERNITRRRQVGVLVDVGHAESIAKFIIEKVNHFRKQHGIGGPLEVVERDTTADGDVPHAG